MNDKDKNVTVYLRDISESLDRIEQFTRNMTIDQFDEDLKTKYAVIRCIEVIGEAVKSIPSDFRIKNPDIPWRKIAAMRDKMIHEYSGVNADMVWEVVERDVPELKIKITELINAQK
ncbi:MAG TPA: DUF86 domain-containing protein [Candidatus Paceibacterota bacterium]